MHPDQILADQYSKKPDIYYSTPRPEIFVFVPQNVKRALDVGCSSGGFAATVKKERGAEVWGVETHHASAETARNVLDKVIEEPFAPGMDLPEKYFDCISFNDVLEHLLDPEQALIYAATLLAPEGVIIASIPNIRYLPAFKDFVFRGNWEYEDMGVMDRTHMRFFTKKSIPLMFTRCGLKVETLQGINGLTTRKLNLLNRLTKNRFEDVKYQQYAVVARKEK